FALARAAIAAMREPTEEMIDAWSRASGAPIKGGWQAMIDAALGGNERLGLRAYGRIKTKACPKITLFLRPDRDWVAHIAAKYRRFCRVYQRIYSCYYSVGVGWLRIKVVRNSTNLRIAYAVSVLQLRPTRGGSSTCLGGSGDSHRPSRQTGNKRCCSDWGRA